MEYDPLPDRSVETETVAVQLPHRRPLWRRVVRGLWIWAWAWAPALAAGGGLVFAARIHMPEVDDLERFQPNLITSLYDDSGAVFKRYATEKRVLIRVGDLPPLLARAVTAVEDANFYEHGGVDLLGVLGAVKENLAASARAGELRIVRGAGTLTMQLARELFLDRTDRSFDRKVAEALLAVEIEKRYSKDQILTLYCNLVNMGHGNYGMEAGARYFFNKSVGELDLAEAATLAGIPQRPADYSPYRRPQAVIERRNKVLRRMLEEEDISAEAYEEAVASPLLVVQRHREETEVGAGFAEEVRRYLEASYGADLLYEGGLEVRTTMDTRIQTAAERSLREVLAELDHQKGWRGPVQQLGAEGLEARELPSWDGIELTDGEWYEGLVLEVGARQALVRIADTTFTLDQRGLEWTRKSRPSDLLAPGDVAWFRLARGEEDVPVLHLEQEPEMEGAVVVLESGSGAVRAMVGGWDFDRSKFNRAVQARRQVGSAFKPLVLGAALERGLTPADTIFDGPVTLPGADNTNSYSPRNYYRRYHGILTLRRAIELSINVTSVKLQDLVGVERVIDFAHRVGITSELPPYPSLALGSADLSPLELAVAYATIANQGVYLAPHFVEEVTSPAGGLLEHHLVEAQKATDPPVAYVLAHVLEGVVDRGTGASMASIDVALAGKTGTTNDYTDAWFLGFTPHYTLAVWIGYDQKRSLGRGMTGARAALPVWRRIVEAGLAEGWIQAGETLVPPPGVEIVPVEYFSGLLPPDGAPTSVRTIDEAFVAGTAPTQHYDAEAARVMALPWYAQESFYLPKEGERMPSDVESWEVVYQAWSHRDG